MLVRMLMLMMTLMHLLLLMLMQALVVQTLRLSMAGFPFVVDCTTMADRYRRLERSEKILLRRPPIVSVSSVKYFDGDNVLQSIDLADVVVDPFGDRALVYPAVDFRWPRTYDSPVAVRTTFVAGHGTTSSSPPQTLYAVPRSVIQAALLIVGHLYENREDTVEKALTSVPLGAMALLQQFRTGMGV
jgi:uncharacterized phiE125 gp8 family phage protein